MAETMAQAIARRRREREAPEAEERARLNGRFRPTSAPAYGQRPGGLAADLRAGILQADSMVRSAANTFTLGGADSLAAGMDALIPAGGEGYWERRAAQLAAERARNAYDVAHRPVSQQIGAGAATAISLLGSAGLAGPARLAGAATGSARETAAILGAGGMSGLAAQNLSDAAAGRPSDWRDEVGATVGGVLGGVARPLGPGRAAAIGAAATTATQNALHGRPVTLDDIGRNAAAGRAVGALAGLAGRQWSETLSPRAKGRLGETLGAVRSAINQMEREPGPKKLFKPAGWKAGTYPDGRSGDILFEDKFGPHAVLSEGQRIAQRVLGPKYILYHFHPEDVGKIVSLWSTGLAPQLERQQPAAPPARRSPR
jgi:hypothetical protein